MPSLRTAVIALAVFVLLTAGTFTIFQIANASQNQAASDTQTVQNESLVQQVGNWILVSKATDQYTAGFNETVTVYNSTGYELTEGTDYKWNESDGAIKFLDTNSTSDSSTANITYDYQENTQAVKDISQPLDTVITGQQFVLVAFAGLGLIALLGALVMFIPSSPGGGR